MRWRWHEADGAQGGADGDDGCVELHLGEAGGAREEPACLDLERVESRCGGGDGGGDGCGERVGSGCCDDGRSDGLPGLGCLQLDSDVAARLGEADGDSMGGEVGVGGDDGAVMGGDGIDDGGEGCEEGRRGESSRGEDGTVGGIGRRLDGGEGDREGSADVLVDDSRDKRGGMSACRGESGKNEIQGCLPHRASRAGCVAQEGGLIDGGRVCGGDGRDAGLDGNGRWRPGRAGPRNPLRCHEADGLSNAEDLGCSDSDGDLEGGERRADDWVDGDDGSVGGASHCEW